MINKDFQKLLKLLYKCSVNDSYVKNILIDHLKSSYGYKYFLNEDEDYLKSLQIEDKSVVELFYLFETISSQLSERHRTKIHLTTYILYGGDIKKLKELGQPNFHNYEKLQEYNRNLLSELTLLKSLNRRERGENITNIPKDSPFLIFDTPVLHEFQLWNKNNYIELTGNDMEDIASILKDEKSYYCFSSKEYTAYIRDIKQFNKLKKVLECDAELVPLTKKGNKTLNVVEEIRSLLRQGNTNNAFQTFLQTRDINSILLNQFKAKKFPIHIINRSEIGRVKMQIMREINLKLQDLLSTVYFKQYCDYLQGNLEDINNLLLINKNLKNTKNRQRPRVPLVGKYVDISEEYYHNLETKSLSEIVIIKNQIYFNLKEVQKPKILNLSEEPFQMINKMFKNQFFIISKSEFTTFLDDLIASKKTKKESSKGLLNIFKRIQN